MAFSTKGFSMLNLVNLENLVHRGKLFIDNCANQSEDIKFTKVTLLPPMMYFIQFFV